MLEMQSYSRLLFLPFLLSQMSGGGALCCHSLPLHEFDFLAPTLSFFLYLGSCMYVLLVILEDDCEDDLGSRAVEHDLFLPKPSFCIMMAG